MLLKISTWFNATVSSFSFHAELVAAYLACFHLAIYDMTITFAPVILHIWLHGLSCRAFLGTMSRLAFSFLELPLGLNPISCNPISSCVQMCTSWDLVLLHGVGHFHILLLNYYYLAWALVPFCLQTQSFAIIDISFNHLSNTSPLCWLLPQNLCLSYTMFFFIWQYS